MKKLAAQVVTVNGPYRTKQSAQQVAALVADPSSAQTHNASAFAFFSEIALAVQLPFIAKMDVDEARVRALSPYILGNGRLPAASGALKDRDS